MFTLLTRGGTTRAPPAPRAVYQPCLYVPNDINALSYTSPLVSDPCLSQGGLDQNIYAAAG